MKPALEKIELRKDKSFAVRKDVLPHICTPWHYHPEFELVFIEKSKGRKIIGDYTDRFKDGDMAFLGPNLPHVWINDDVYYKKGSKLKFIGWVVHFTPSLFGNDFLTLPEMRSVRRLMEKAEAGLNITGKTKTAVTQKIKELKESKSAERILLLLQILITISRSKGVQLMASKHFTASRKSEDSIRLNKVYSYISINFRESIKLETLADLANMSQTSFCRFFRKKTGKSFTDFLNQTRIDYAKKILITHKAKSISEIGYESGFNSPSYFNKIFKRLEKNTPLDYRDEP